MRWKDYEDNYLRTYPKATARDLAAALGRSKRSVDRRRAALKIRRESKKLIQCSAHIPQEHYMMIMTLAKAHNIPFAEAIRGVVRIGIHHMSGMGEKKLSPAKENH